MTSMMVLSLKYRYVNGRVMKSLVEYKELPDQLVGQEA